MVGGLALVLACDPPEADEEQKDTTPPYKAMDDKTNNIKDGFALVPNNYKSGSKLILAFNEAVTMDGWREKQPTTHKATTYFNVYQSNTSETSLWIRETEKATIEPEAGIVKESTSGDIYTQYWVLTLGTPLKEGNTLYPRSGKIKDKAGNDAPRKQDGEQAAFTLPEPDTNTPSKTDATDKDGNPLDITTTATKESGYVEGKKVQLVFNDLVMVKDYKEPRYASSYFNVTPVSGSRTWTNNKSQLALPVIMVNNQYVYDPRYVITFNNNLYSTVWLIILKGNSGLVAGDKLHPKSGQVVDRSGNAADASSSGDAAFTLPTLK